MTMVEIFSRIGTQMVKGMMVHEQLMKAYLFLGLNGNAACHEYHHLSETKAYISICKYANDHFDMILKSDDKFQGIPDIIPQSWYVNTRDKVDTNTRTQAMEEALITWIEWEESTKKVYENLYLDLEKLDVPAAEYVKSLVLDVEEEIVYARKELLVKRSMAFDIVSIMEEQEEMERTFRKKIKKAFNK